MPLPWPDVTSMLLSAFDNWTRAHSSQHRPSCAHESSGQAIAWRWSHSRAKWLSSPFSYEYGIGSFWAIGSSCWTSADWPVPNYNGMATLRMCENPKQEFYYLLLFFQQRMNNLAFIGDVWDEIVLLGLVDCNWSSWFLCKAYGYWKCGKANDMVRFSQSEVWLHSINI